MEACTGLCGGSHLPLLRRGVHGGCRMQLPCLPSISYGPTLPLARGFGERKGSPGGGEEWASMRVKRGRSIGMGPGM